MKTIALPVTVAAMRGENHPADFKLALAGGLTAHIRTERDDDHEAPWEDGDGRGIVSNWTTRDKRPGERVLSSDGRSKRFYDYAATIEIAKRDGWDAPPYKTGTKDQQAARAVEADFEFCRSWCADEWEYIGVIVTLTDGTGRKVGKDSIWGIESCENPGHGFYWHEQAAEMVNALAEAHAAESAERAEWEARDTVTI
jgi:hypothetical protein